MTVRFSNQLVAELYQPFWAAWQAGEFLTDAAAVAGTHRHRGLAWLRQAGGVRPRRGRDLQGRYLSFADREEIALARAAGESMRTIAARLGRSPSTISRELARNGDRCGRYRASSAHVRAPMTDRPAHRPGGVPDQRHGHRRAGSLSQSSAPLYAWFQRLAGFVDGISDHAAGRRLNQSWRGGTTARPSSEQK